MPLQASIDRTALRANLRTLRAAAPKSRVMAVVKANAYGHGIGAALEALTEADGFAVARLEEAIALDAISLGRRPILLLEGAADRQACAEALRRGFDLVLHHRDQLDWLSEAPVGSLTGAGAAALGGQAARTARLWIKFDTGMNRLGFTADELPQVVAGLQRLRAQGASTSGSGVRVCLMSHFACADEPDRSENSEQESRFAMLRSQWESLDGGAVPASLCNSAALLTRPAAQYDWVRPGISLYGVSPFANRTAQQLGLQPVMTLQSKVIALRSLQSGESVGYGATWRATRRSRIAIVAAGYADGLPRHLPSGAPVLVAGQRAPVAGRVSMDMLAIDVTDVPEVTLGSPAVLWGAGLPVEEVATAAGTLAYELLCALNSRVPVQIL